MACTAWRAYDGMRVVENALLTLKGRRVTRENLRAALGKVHVEGLTASELSFPKGYGDVIRRGISLVKIVAPGVYAPLNG